MKNRPPHLFLLHLLLLGILCNPLFISVAKATNYLFDGYWPQLEEQWYFNNPNNIKVSPDGSVYVADTGNHRIQKFDASGKLIKTWGERGYKEDGQFNSPNDIAIASNGDIYVADTVNSRVQQFSSEGKFIRKWGSYSSIPNPKQISITPDGSIYTIDTFDTLREFNAQGDFIQSLQLKIPERKDFKPLRIAVAPDGSIYAIANRNTRLESERLTNVVYQFTPQGNFIRSWLAWSAQPDKSIASDKNFVTASISITADGSIYLSNRLYLDRHKRSPINLANNIQQFSAKGVLVREWGSDKSGTKNGQFNTPQGIAVSSDGSVYIADTLNDRIQKFNSRGEFISAWGGIGLLDGHGIASAPNGTVYVADTANHRVQQFTLQGDFIRKWGKEGTDQGEFLEPRAISIGLDGSVYVADREYDHIHHFTSQGNFIRKWGVWGSGGYEGRNDKNEQLVIPQDIATAPDGSLYILESGPDISRISHYSAQGDFIDSWGRYGGIKIWGNYLDGTFNDPQSITVASDGSIYVTDNGYLPYHHIQQFTAKGDFIREWGRRKKRGDMFFTPHGITTTPDGSVLVVDTKNSRIQQFTAEGDFINSFGKRGLEATLAGRFITPYDITVDDDGTLFVTDISDHRIQRFIPENRAVASYNDKTGLLKIKKVKTSGDTYYVELKDQGGFQFSLKNSHQISLSSFVLDTSYPAFYTFDSLLLDIPKVSAFGKTYKVKMKNNGSWLLSITEASEL